MRHRDEELAWLSNHGSELSRYGGHYLIIEGSSLISHGTDLKAVVEEARTRGVSVPFIHRVSDHPNPPDFWMGT